MIEVSDRVKKIEGQGVVLFNYENGIPVDKELRVVSVSEVDEFGDYYIKVEGYEETWISHKVFRKKGESE